MEAFKLVGRVHGGTGNVFVQTDFGRIIAGVEPAADRLVFLDLLALGAQHLRLSATFASGDEIAAGRLVVLHLRFHDEVLDQPLVLDRRGQRLYGSFAMRHLAGIARGLFQLVQRHEDFNAGNGLCGRGFDNSVHFPYSMGFRAAGIAALKPCPSARPGVQLEWVASRGTGCTEPRNEEEEAGRKPLRKAPGAEPQAPNRNTGSLPGKQSVRD